MFPSGFRPFLCVVLLMGSLSSLNPAWTKSASEEKTVQRQEESDNYFEKWLKEDVVYIISEDEKDVFENLSTPQEKERFIEQFWFRRDPDARTAANEFKEEHYRRIAYANERFSSGDLGWFTDRGRIYIIHGPPAQIESHPAGGTYERPFYEGGGTTSTFPFEIWRYRYIEGIGTDVVIEFVDPTLTGECRLALRPQEKDALRYVSATGLTFQEEMGLASKADRHLRSYTDFGSLRIRDRPFARYETYVQVQRGTPVKYRDLKGLVEVDVSFDNLPFSHRVDYFSLNNELTLVLLSAELETRELTFDQEATNRRARVAIYGIATSLSNRIADEFEAELVAKWEAHRNRYAFQRILVLERKGRYKLGLVIKDLNSGKTGVRRLGLIPPPPETDLTASSVFLSRSVRQLEEVPDQEKMFVLGDLHIRPSLDNVFRPSDQLYHYVQVYNFAFDQTTMRPSLKLEYEIRREDRPVIKVIEDQGESIQFVSSQRAVLLQPFSLSKLQAGPYKIALTVTDLIGEGEVHVTDHFEVTPKTPG